MITFEFSSAVLVVLVLFLVAAIYGYYASSPHNLPPGPAGLPFVGCAPYISVSTAYATLSEWQKAYGPLISFYIGNTLIIVLGDTNTIKEALVKQGYIFSGRPKVSTPKFLLVTKNPHIGMINADGLVSKEQRRLVMSTLRDFGGGRSLMEAKVNEEVEFVLEQFSSFQGRAFDPQKPVTHYVANVNCSIIFGKRFDYQDEKFMALMDLLGFIGSLSETNIFSPYHHFPLMWLFTNFLMVRDAMKKVFNFNQGYIEEHRETFDSNDEPDDYIHAYMNAQATGSWVSMDDINLNAAITDLIAAGTEATATTLRWALIYIGLHPDVQRKVLLEIEGVVGAENIPAWADRAKLPYTEAVIMEIQRVANILPTALPHRTISDTTLMGYHIPENAIVIPLLWAAHGDSAEFQDVNRFDPMRFLEDGGETHRKYDSFMPFSAGKRMCPGEALAKMEVYMFFTAIIVRFRIHFEGIDPPNPKDFYSGTAIAPKPFKLIAEARN